MNCQEFWEQAPEGANPPNAAWTAHRRECAACAASWTGQRQVAEGLRRVAGEWSRLQAPARVEARLVRAFRGEDGLRGASLGARPWIPALTWAAASLTVMGLAFSLVHVREPQTVAPRPVPANAAILAALQEMPEAADAETGFLPLPNVEQLSPNEQGDVVTVEVPRSAMMALGFEVSPERAAEPVQAEVMFGPDGVARAVRFLDETF